MNKRKFEEACGKNDLETVKKCWQTYKKNIIVVNDNACQAAFEAGYFELGEWMMTKTNCMGGLSRAFRSFVDGGKYEDASKVFALARSIKEKPQTISRSEFVRVCRRGDLCAIKYMYTLRVGTQKWVNRSTLRDGFQCVCACGHVPIVEWMIKTCAKPKTIIQGMTVYDMFRIPEFKILNILTNVEPQLAQLWSGYYKKWMCNYPIIMDHDDTYHDGGKRIAAMVGMMSTRMPTDFVRCELLPKIMKSCRVIK